MSFGERVKELGLASRFIRVRASCIGVTPIGCGKA